MSLSEMGVQTYFNVNYGQGEDQRLDIYVHISTDSTGSTRIADLATLIYFHGGGWVGGAKENERYYLGYYLEKKFNVVNIEYRRGQNTAPNAVEDAMCAIKWLSENGSRYSINLDQTILSGGSAGGHLALITGLLNSTDSSHACHCGDAINIRGIVNWYGITDIAALNTFLELETPEGNYALAWAGSSEVLNSISKKYSPVHYIDSTSPPVLTIHGNADEVVPYQQALSLHDALENVGVRNELITINNGRHLGSDETNYADYYPRIFEFLEKELN